MDLAFRKQQLEILKSKYTATQLQHLAKTHGTPILLLDEAAVIQAYKDLCDVMPAVRPHFAIKSCPIPELLEIYKNIGANLDVATNGEIALLEACNYPPELLVHTHPHKRPEDMRRAYEYGIRTFVVDNVSEIPVLEPYKKDIKIMFRLSFPNKYAMIDLSYKFGLDPEEAKKAIKVLLDNNFDVEGVCFHVGSQTDGPTPYIDALNATAKFFSTIKDEYGHVFKKLDIGGGFPAPYIEDVPGIDVYAAAINPILQDKFPGIEVISEPGRYLINKNITLLTRAISSAKRGPQNWLFLDDGVYGSFSDMISGHMSYMLYGLEELNNKPANERYIVSGPTCDSIDVMSTDAMLCRIEAGDIVIVPNIGAYSFALATEFNSIARAKVVVI